MLQPARVLQIQARHGGLKLVGRQAEVATACACLNAQVMPQRWTFAIHANRDVLH